MPKYAIMFSYSSDSWSQMVQNPSDRAAATRQLAESVGGTLETFYWMFGPHDGLAIVDVPDSVTAAALSVAVASTGAVSNIETHELITADDATALLQRAGSARSSYQQPGA